MLVYKPLVAIVGRPNVGKSTFFNKIAGHRIAIVDDMPGVTRDRIYADSEWTGHPFTLIDTGGIDTKSDDVLLLQMRKQAEAELGEDFDIRGFHDLILAQGQIPMTVKELITLPGVGRKTANVITSVVDNQPNMAVDTHVFRVSNRIGLVKAKTTLETEKQLVKNLPQDLIYIAHIP